MARSDSSLAGPGILRETTINPRTLGLHNIRVVEFETVQLFYQEAKALIESPPGIADPGPWTVNDPGLSTTLDCQRPWTVNDPGLRQPAAAFVLAACCGTLGLDMVME